MKAVYPLLGFAINLLQPPLQGIFVFASMVEISPKNARAISSLLKEVMEGVVMMSFEVKVSSVAGYYLPYFPNRPCVVAAVPCCGYAVCCSALCGVQ